MRKVVKALVMVMIFGSLTWAEPVIESSSQKFNFGLTIQNSTITQTFWLKSTGTDTVLIKKIESGCSCTSIPLESDRIAPGDSLKLSIFWETRNTFGNFTKYPKIYSNGSDEPLRIIIKANVQLLPDSTFAGSIWPFKFEMGKTANMSIDSLQFRIINNTDSVFSPRIISTLPDQCEIFLPESVPPKSSVVGYALVRPEFLDEEFVSSFTVDFKYGKGNYVTVPIRRKFYMRENR